jgi:hypothetical protein
MENAMSTPQNLSAPQNEPLTDSVTLPSGDVVMTLDRSVAVVLLDLISRITSDPAEQDARDDLEHPAELAALYAVRGVLENALGEPLADNYEQQIDEARTAVITRLEANA